MRAREQLIELTFTFMAFFGLVLMGYGFLALYLQSPWPPLDAIANWASAIVTLLGALFVGGAVYLPAHAREADAATKHYYAPLILLLLAQNGCS